VAVGAGSSGAVLSSSNGSSISAEARASFSAAAVADALVPARHPIGAVEPVASQFSDEEAVQRSLHAEFYDVNVQETEASGPKPQEKGQEQLSCSSAQSNEAGQKGASPADAPCCDCKPNAKCYKAPSCPCKQAKRHCVNCRADCTNRMEGADVPAPTDCHDEESYVRGKLAEVIKRVEELEASTERNNDVGRKHMEMIFNLGNKFSKYDEAIKGLERSFTEKILALEHAVSQLVSQLAKLMQGEQHMGGRAVKRPRESELPEEPQINQEKVAQVPAQGQEGSARMEVDQDGQQERQGELKQGEPKQSEAKGEAAKQGVGQQSEAMQSVAQQGVARQEQGDQKGEWKDAEESQNREVGAKRRERRGLKGDPEWERRVAQRRERTLIIQGLEKARERDVLAFLEAKKLAKRAAVQGVFSRWVNGREWAFVIFHSKDEMEDCLSLKRCLYGSSYYLNRDRSPEERSKQRQEREERRKLQKERARSPSPTNQPAGPPNRSERAASPHERSSSPANRPAGPALRSARAAGSPSDGTENSGNGQPPNPPNGRDFPTYPNVLPMRPMWPPGPPPVFPQNGWSQRNWSPNFPQQYIPWNPPYG
jgi:hypothetical protein